MVVIFKLMSLHLIWLFNIQIGQIVNDMNYIRDFFLFSERPTVHQTEAAGMSLK